MKTKFEIGDALRFKVDVCIQFISEAREIDTDELKNAVDLFIRIWVFDDQLCPVIEEGVNDERSN